jgi:transposase-like protein
LEAQILGLYSRGMTTRDIADQLGEMYGVEVSAEFISSVTDSIMPLVQEWQTRPLRDVYAIVFLDAIHYKIRQEGEIISKASYTVMGIDLNGQVDVLGIWIGEKEGIHFWNGVLLDLKSRGVKDILITA